MISFSSLFFFGDNIDRRQGMGKEEVGRQDLQH